MVTVYSVKAQLGKRTRGLVEAASFSELRVLLEACPFGPSVELVGEAEEIRRIAAEIQRQLGAYGWIGRQPEGTDVAQSRVGPCSSAKE